MKNDCSDKVQFIETSLPVELIKYNDMPLWPYIRLDLFAKYESYDMGEGDRKGLPAFQAAKKLAFLFSAIAKTSLRLFFLKNGTILYTSRLCTAEVDGKLTDRFCFPLLEKYKTIVPIVQEWHNLKVSYRHYISEDVVFFLISRIKKHIAIEEAKIQGFDTFSKVCELLNVSLDLEDEIKIILASRRFYRAWFAKSLPSNIFIVCYYSCYRMALVSVAHDMKIPVVELQHGAIPKGHFTYNTFKKTFNAPYPDRLFIFGEFWRQNIKGIYDESRIFVTGSSYLDFVSKGVEKNKAIFEGHFGDIIKNRSVITVASQRGVVDRKLCNICSQLQRKYPQLFIIFKPRPYESYHKEYESDGFVVETELDTYICMQNSSVVITGWSTCSYEALSLGTPVLSIDFDGCSKKMLGDDFDGLDSVRFVSETAPLEEIESNIMELSSLNRISVRNDGELFFASNSECLLQEVLKTVV